jgi:hypothetical protein
MFPDENGNEAGVVSSLIPQVVDSERTGTGFRSQPDAYRVEQDRVDHRVQNRRIDEYVQPPILPLHTTMPWSEKYRFPTQSDCDEVQERADGLPDMVVIAFEEAVTDVKLEGWEDMWVSKGRYIGPKLAEPKIDFVYNCRFNKQNI